MMKKVATVMLLTGAAAASLGAYYARRGKTEVTVNTTMASVGDVVQSVSATGTLEAVSTVDVGSQVSGTIARLGADFNSIVRKGQLLAEIDPSLLHAQTEQARANLLSQEAGAERLQVTLADARTTLKRSEELHARLLVTDSDLDTARVAVRVGEAQLKAGEAQLAQAQASLRTCTVNEQHALIYAPIDGIVIARSVDVGQTVQASMQAPTLFSLAADLAHLRVKAAVSESDIGLVHEGQSVTFRVDAYAGETFTGRVSQIRLQPVTSSNVVTYTTMIDVPNPSLKLRPGMTATTTIVVARRDGVLRVPNTALRFRPTTAMFAALGQATPARASLGPRTSAVWTWANARLDRIALTTGISDGTYTEVVSGGPSDTVQLVTTLTLPSSGSTSSTASPLMQQNGPPPGMPPPLPR